MKSERRPKPVAPATRKPSTEEPAPHARRAPRGTTSTRRRHGRSTRSLQQGNGDWVPRVATAHGTAPALQLGDVMICGPHGVGEVVAAGIEEIAGEREAFYTMRLHTSGMRVIFPARRVTEVGLRPLATKKQATEILAKLKRPRRARRRDTWNKRQKKLTAKLHTGLLKEAADVLAQVLLQKKRKELSVTETKLLDAARARVVSELAIATGRSEAAISAEIDGYFGF